jgi:Na+/proline symporter
MESLKENWAIWLLMLVYLAFCFGVGWYFRIKAARGVNDFYVAKRQIPGWVVSLAFFSTFASTNTYIGQAGKAFSAGLSWAWVGVFWTFFCIISWLLLGPRLRNQTSALNSVTVPDYFDFRYRSSLSKAIRILSAVVVLFATIWYMVGIAKGCANLLESLLDVPFAWGAFGIIACTCAYTVWGGMYSVLWTDAIQGLMMFGVAVLMVTLPFIYVGDASELMTRLAETTHVTKDGDPIGDGLVTFATLVSFTYILGIGLAVGMKQISEPRCLIRFYSVNDAKGMKFAMLWTPIFLGISLVCVMGLGALVHGMATDEEAFALAKDTDKVVGFMLAKFDNQLVSGICLAGLFAAGMSSLASVMLIVGTAAVNDIWKLWKPIPQASMIRATRLTIVVYCALVFFVTLLKSDGIVELTAFSGALFAASFFPAIFGGLYLRWGTGHGAFWSMVIGLVSCVVWRFAFRLRIDSLKDIHEIIPSFVVSFIAYLVISKMTQKHVPDSEHLDRIFVNKTA